MEKIRQIMLLLSNGISQNTICKTVGCSKRTVSEISKVADSSGHSFEELLGMADSELGVALKRTTSGETPPDNRREKLDSLMSDILKRLNRPHAHMRYVFDSYYCKECPQHYGYTQFKKYVHEHIEKTNYSFHKEYEPGRDWQIDFAGDPLYLTDRLTRERIKLSVLVCVMPRSNLIFMIALPNATTEHFFYGLNKGLQYMGALPKVAHTDNMRQWVNKSDRYSLTFSDGAREWALYYGIEPTACRVRKPRDKGPVEGAVNQLYQYVYARLEEEEYYTLEALNNRISQLLDEYNRLPYKGSSRWDIFLEEEKPLMKALPLTMYSFKLRKEVKLGPDYHVRVGKPPHLFSCPFQYVGQKIRVLWDATTVEIYSGLDLICVHTRSTKPYGYTTVPGHMPPAHQAYIKKKAEQNAASFIEQGRRIGIHLGLVMEKVLASQLFPQQAYARCHGILSLLRDYDGERVDAACRILLESNLSISYQSLKDMLKNKRDMDHEDIISTTPYNEDVRGPQAFMLDTDLPQNTQYNKDDGADSDNESDNDNVGKEGEGDE